MPSSHCSPVSTVALPHLGRHCLSHLLAAVPLTAVPSSHFSGAWMMPSPQLTVGTYAEQSALHEPGRPVFWPSSHFSVPLIRPSPQMPPGKHSSVHEPTP